MTLRVVETDGVLRDTFAADRLPEWTADAACRSADLRDSPAWPHPRARWMKQAPGIPSGTHFGEGKTIVRDIENTPWQRSIVNAMAVCGTCPVRRQCLDYAYATEMTWPDYAESWAAAFTPRPMELRFGVWGGVPGPVRGRYARFVERLELCEEWFQRHTQQRVAETSEGIGA